MSKIQTFFKVILIILTVSAVAYFLSLISVIGDQFPGANPAWKFFAFFMTLVPIMGFVGAVTDNQHILFFNICINIVLFVPIFIWAIVTSIQFGFLESEDELDASAWKLAILLVSCGYYVLIGIFEYLMVREIRKSEELEEQNLKETEEGLSSSKL